MATRISRRERRYLRKSQGGKISVVACRKAAKKKRRIRKIWILINKP